jgi:hypothetical protein
MDAGSAPERIGEAHLADQPPNFRRYAGPARTPTRFPAPEAAKASSVRSHQAEEHPPDQLEQVPHGPSWPDSWPQAKWMGFATGTAIRRTAIVARTRPAAQTQIRCAFAKSLAEFSRARGKRFSTIRYKPLLSAELRRVLSPPSPRRQ